MLYFTVLGVAILIYLFDYGYHQHKRAVITGRLSTTIFAFILFLMAAVRYENEYLSDFAINYRRIIQAKYMSWPECFANGGAIGNALFRKAIAEVFGNPQWYFVITAFIIVYCTAYIIKKYSPTFFLPLLLFYTIGSYFASNNVTRQAMAVAIVMLSWKYIFKRQFIKFMIVILLAVSIHISAVFFIPMYFLSKITLGRNQYIYYLLFGVAIFIARNPVIWFFQQLVYSNYTETSYGTVGSNPLRLLLTIIIAAFLYIYSKEFHNVRKLAVNNCGDKNPEVFVNFLGHSTVINILLSIFSATNMLLFSRLAMFWSFQSILCIVYSIKASKKSDRLLLMAIIVIVSLIWFSVMEIAGKHIPTPYTPFWLIPNKPII